MNVAVATLNKRMPEITDALNKKEQVILLHEGKQFARLQPVFDIEAEVERISKHPAIGMWADREDMEDPEEWLRNKRQHRRERLWSTAGDKK